MTVSPTAIRGARPTSSFPWPEALQRIDFRAFPCVLQRAVSIAPDSRSLQDKVVQTKPLAAMQTELLALRAKHTNSTQQVAAAALTPPRSGKKKGRGASKTGRQFANGAEVLRLLDQGEILINGQDEQGRTPLLWATVHGMDELVALLLAQVGSALPAVSWRQTSSMIAHHDRFAAVCSGPRTGRARTSRTEQAWHHFTWRALHRPSPVC